jgi:hypothetical protein
MVKKQKSLGGKPALPLIVQAQERVAGEERRHESTRMGTDVRQTSLPSVSIRVHPWLGSPYGSCSLSSAKSYYYYLRDSANSTSPCTVTDCQTRTYRTREGVNRQNENRQTTFETQVRHGWLAHPCIAGQAN